MPSHARRRLVLASLGSIVLAAVVIASAVALRHRAAAARLARLPALPKVAPAPAPMPAAPSSPPRTGPPGVDKALAYGALGQRECTRELERRGVPFTPTDVGQPSVKQPMRLTGPLRGVTFRGAGLAASPAPARRRVKRTAPTESIYTVADCRLLVALDDVAAIVREHGIVEVLYFSMYRPRATHIADKPSQHERGLAIDVAAFVREDGSRFDVLTGFGASIGAPPCEPQAAPAFDEALELRSIVCRIFEEGIFNVLLTPNANEEHRDHFHFDITAGARWVVLE